MIFKSKARTLAAGLALLGFQLLSTAAHAEVWTTSRNWDESQEAKFSQFVAKFPLDAFTNPQSRYYRISTDCADAAYTLRTLFAYENGLPVDFYTTEKNPRTHQRWELKNTTSMFDGTKDQFQRVKKFIDYVNAFTSTSTLPYDSYPVQINTKFIRPGTMFLNAPFMGTASQLKKLGASMSYLTGHVYYLQRVQENGMVTYIGSTVPSAVRNLSARQGIFFAPVDTRSGYRRWKWPNSEVRPGESQEQFTSRFGWKAGGYDNVNLWATWQENIQSRLRTRQISPKEEYLASEANFRAALMERATAVILGWNHYQKNYAKGQCMSSEDYESHSTPTRDKKIQVELQIFEAAVEKFADSEATFMNSMFGGGRAEKIRELHANFRVSVIPGRAPLNFNQINDAFMTRKVLQVSEPEHSPEVRWGLSDQGTWVCPHRAKQYKGSEAQ